MSDDEKATIRRGNRLGFLRRRVDWYDLDGNLVETETLPWGIWWSLRRWDMTRLALRAQRTNLPCGCTKTFGRVVLCVVECEDHGIGKMMREYRDDQVVDLTEPGYGDGDATGEEKS